MRFEKVRYVCFFADSLRNGFVGVDAAYDGITIPIRKTGKSCGYDFITPYPVKLKPGERRTIPTGIKAIMDDGEMLLLAIRSSVGIKDGVLFSNGIGIIDADFANNENDDGDIKLALWNTSDKTVNYSAGDRIAQGIFFKFGVTDDDNAIGIRTGGVGSTGA